MDTFLAKGPALMCRWLAVLCSRNLLPLVATHSDSQAEAELPGRCRTTTRVQTDLWLCTTDGCHIMCTHLPDTDKALQALQSFGAWPRLAGKAYLELGPEHQEFCPGGLKVLVCSPQTLVLRDLQHQGKDA